jgi:hypothetical protein
VAQQTLEVQQLVGQNRNRIHGQAGGLPIEPYRVFNLAPHRQGGYTPYGRRVRLNDGTSDITLVNVPRMLGYDETGISSFCSAIGGSGTLSLFRDVRLYTQAYPSYMSVSDAVHMDNAGAYISRDAYLVLDRDNRPVEPIQTTITATAEPGSPVFALQVSADIGSFADVAYGNGYFIAVTTLGYIYRSNNIGETWQQVAHYPGAALRSIDYGNGTFIASSNTGYIYRTDSNGDPGSWTQVLVGTAPWETGSVSYGGGDDWFIAGQGANVAQNAGIYKSANKGVNWYQVSRLRRTGIYTTFEDWYVERVAVDVTRPPSTRLYAGVGYASDPLSNTAQEVFVDRENNGESFSTASNIMACNSGFFNQGQVYSGYGFSWTEWCGSYMCAVNTFNGNIAVSQSLASNCGIAWWSVPVTGLAGFGGLRKVKYNRAVGSIAVVGGVSSPRVWLGSSPSSLVRNQEIEDAISAAGGSSVRSVAFDENGHGVYVGSSGVIASSGAAPGLQEGTYNLYFVSYFNTKAGRFVHSLQRSQVSFNRLVGNTVTFQAETKRSIRTSNAWLSSLSDADRIAIVDSLRFDVYIQYVPTAADIPEDELTFSQQTAETTIRYAFTVPYPDSGDWDVNYAPIDRSIGELPIGRQIVSQGAPTTVVFEKSRTEVGEPVRSRTAVHAGRVWGLAAQDEDRWPQGDGIGFEIANQFNRFVLTYTETGWANLVSDQSFIPIQPTQSANFTGMIGTPSGLMVMFDNEIFLVTGDPAFGNVTVELFLDMIGCDLGSTPGRMGGLVFVVWDGRVWVVQAAQAVDISRTQWRPDDPFVRVTAEPQTRSVLAVTRSGRVLRYFIDDQFWMTDPINRADFILGELLPNCVCEPDDHTRFVQPTGQVWITKTDGTPDTPHLVYRDMDFGFPDRRTPLYKAKVTFEGPLVGAEFDRDSGDYDSEAVPGMFYEAGSSSNGVTHQSINAQPGGIQPVMGEPGTQRVATMSFRMPLRVSRSFTISTRFELRGMTYADVIKAPVRFIFATGGESK